MIIINDVVNPIMDKIKPADPVYRVRRDKERNNHNGKNGFEEELKKEEKRQEKKREEKPKENRVDTYCPTMTLDEIIESNSSILTNRGNINVPYGTYNKNGQWNR